jgi:hypothetical protein
MGQEIEVTIPVTTEETVTASREMMSVLILGDGNIYWKVETIYGGKTVKTEWYNVPFSELAMGMVVPEGHPDPFSMTYLEAIEGTLWAKTDEIDALPEGTPDEIRVKHQRYGVQFEYHISR